MNDIEREWQYRRDEALGLNRNPKRAETEANEWRNKIENEQENTKGRFTEPKESGALS